jgi:hypothetical protein
MRKLRKDLTDEDGYICPRSIARNFHISIKDLAKYLMYQRFC